MIVFGGAVVVLGLVSIEPVVVLGGAVVVFDRAVVILRHRSVVILRSFGIDARGEVAGTCAKTKNRGGKSESFHCEGCSSSRPAT